MHDDCVGVRAESVLEMRVSMTSAASGRSRMFWGICNHAGSMGSIGCDAMTVRSHISRRFDIDVLR